MNARRCDLQSALGRSEVCTRELCPFWERGGCILAGVRPDVTETPALAELLLRLRHQLEDALAPGSALLPPEYR